MNLDLMDFDVLEEEEEQVVIGVGEFSNVIKAEHKSGRVFAIKIVFLKR